MNNSMRNRNIIILLNVILGLTLFLYSSGCSTAERFPGDSHIKISEPSVFKPGFQKALYKSEMKIFGNDLSGLTMIKKKGMAYRVVFMSELGLKYYDLEFSTLKDSVTVHYVINLLDHKQVNNILQNMYKAMFMVFPEKTKEKYYDDAHINSAQKVYKSGSRKSLYNYDKHFGTVKTINQKYKSTRLSINISSYEGLSPEKVNINQKNFNLHLEQIEP